jgi:Icc protein
MLIAQITDIHLGFEPGNPRELNRIRLDKTLETLCAMEPRPDLLLCTGDLTDKGDLEAFRRLREALASLPFPYFLGVGNHDERGPLFEVFPQTRTESGFVQYAIEDWPLRILMLDTLEHGRHAGAFGEVRARWVAERLDETPGRPTLLALHHPPAFTGIDWMTFTAEETWGARLADVVAGRPNIVGAICGHLHRPAIAPWAGTCVRVCSSVAPQVALELKPIDLDRPDGRPMVQLEPPAFALHSWTPETGLVTHFGRVEDVETLIRYDERFQPVLRRFAEERSQEPADSPVAPDPVVARKRSGFSFASLFGLRRRPAPSPA